MATIPATDQELEAAVEGAMTLVEPEVDDFNLDNARALTTLLAGYVLHGDRDGSEALIDSVEYGWPQVFVTAAETVRFMRDRYGSDPDRLARIDRIAQSAKISS